MRKASPGTLFKYLSASLMIAFSLPNVRAETTNCTEITSIPYVITQQGVYCLTGNVVSNMTSGNAIDIQANNVTIDLNGYKIGGLSAGAGTQTTGIYAYQRKNITIKNGSIRGFYRGIYLEDPHPYTTSTGHRVENVLADGNRAIGIWIDGYANTARNNTVINTGGSSISHSAYGLWIVGNYAVIEGNNINNTIANRGYSAYGILLNNSDGSVVQNNLVTKAGDASQGGLSRGISIASSSGVTLRNNIVAVAGVGLHFGFSPDSKYIDTITNGVATPYVGGISIGNNY